MRTQIWYHMAAMGVVIGVLALGGGVLTPSSVATHGTPITPPTPPPSTSFVTLTILGGGSPTSYAWSPSYAVVPAHAKVVFTIVNHDPYIGTPSSPIFANVIGTLGGVEQMTLGTQTYNVTGLSVKFVSQTFTILMGPLVVNAPIPPMMGSLPSQVVFTVIFPGPGDLPFGSTVGYNAPPGYGMQGLLQVN